ncbi:FGGY-family carbohydrate kinase [Flavihumibacter sp. UBA7668]|uniref:FGGY-family carbohydrate kinase n=1 Tax=Flavihumibacter sp. UBA7668 TaxID=1946542 RepID=UPI0025BA8575|nr:FGGY family carbohydrate kinase [Flavihumibacter sp. UBA7668]
MPVIAVIAIFDIGKTNKKLLIFNDQFELIEQVSKRIEEIQDEDGFSCDDLMEIEQFVFSGLDFILQRPDWILKAVNFSAYGASLVYIDDKGKPLTPLYNYLKPYPDALLKALLDKYGGAERWSRETASPVLGSLNSGLQLYRIKNEQPELFSRIKYALHLPQYLAYLLTKLACSDFTSVGCHTGLWNFDKMKYHAWVELEGLSEKLAPLFPSNHKERVEYKNHSFWCGIGVHDSSGALLPYLQNTQTPFVLLSTGTWCITLNPFNNQTLTKDQLLSDCLCYLMFNGNPVMASRLFAGQEHEAQVTRIAEQFKQSKISVEESTVNLSFIPKTDLAGFEAEKGKQTPIDSLRFRSRNIESFKSASEAYHQLIFELVEIQVQSMRWVLTNEIRLIFIDGGFAKNKLFLHFLKESFPGIEIQTSEISQASALGAALLIEKISL